MVNILQKNRSLHYLITAAVLAALTTVATIFIQIPNGRGYFNLGDAVLMIGGLLLGPKWGLAIGGIGSGLADLLTGYAVFAPITLVVKGFEGWLTGYIFERSNHRLAALIPSGLVMAGGYFVAEIVMFGFGPALAAVPGNVFQGLVGAAVAYVLYPQIERFAAPYFSHSVY